MAEENRNAELVERTGKTLGTMLDYLGLEAEIKVEIKENVLEIRITSPEAGRIIGRKGQTLDCLQLLLNRIMFKGEEDCPRISIDIDGYAGRGERGERGERGDRRERGDRPYRPRGERRGSGISEEQLAAQAQDAAKEVKKWGEPVTLPPMNAHDRRIIHITLENDPEIMTESDAEEENGMKKVTISLKKA